MKVRCIATHLTSEQAAAIGGRWPKTEFGLRLGKDYAVIGLTFSVESAGFGCGTWLHLEADETGEVPGILVAPVQLFEIIDPRASPLWTIRATGPEVSLLPPAFQRPFFHDDLSAGRQDAINDFEEAIRQLQSEQQRQL